MIVLALDSGLEKTGYAFFEKSANGSSDFKYITSGLIETSSKKTTEKRLQEIYNAVRHLAKKYKAQVVVIEQLFFFKNRKTAIKVSQAQGAILLLAAQKKLKVAFLTPLQIKQIITGYGQADKKSVQKMIAMTLHLKKKIKQDDVADAVACGLAYCYLNQKLLE